MGARAHKARARDEQRLRTIAPGGIRGLSRATDSAIPHPRPQPPAQLHQRSGEMQLPPSRSWAARRTPRSPGPRRPCHPHPPALLHQAVAPLSRFSALHAAAHILLHPSRRPGPRRGRAEKQTETHRPLWAAGSGASYRSGSITGWSRRARHQLRQTRGAVAWRARRARRQRLQPQLPAPPFGRRPTCPAALHALGRTTPPSCKRELLVSPPRLRHRRGWGREDGLRSPRHRPCPAAPPPLVPPPPFVPDIDLSVWNLKTPLG